MLKDVETGLEFVPKNLIDGMKAVRQDFLDDFGIELGQNVNDVYQDELSMKYINDRFRDELRIDINGQQINLVDENGDSYGVSNWVRVRIIFINMVVSSGFIASYSMYGLYSMLIFGISTVLKPICMFNTFMGWLHECSHP